MNKKLGLLFSAILILSFIIGVLSSQSTDIPGLPSGVNTQQVENLGNQISSLPNNGQNITQQWVNSILANPTIKGIDSFLHSINIVFFVLFGQNYSLSLTLFISIVLWILTVVLLYKVLKNYSSFSKGVSFIISIIFIIILAQVGILKSVSNFISSAILSVILWLLGYNNAWWIPFAIVFFIILVFILLLALFKNLGNKHAKKKQQQKEEENRLKLKTGAEVAEDISKAAAKIGEK